MGRYWRGICEGQQGGKSGEGDRVGQGICDAAPGPSGKWTRALRRGGVDMARGARRSVYHVGAGMQCPEWARERVICDRRWARAGCGVRLIYRLIDFTSGEQSCWNVRCEIPHVRHIKKEQIRVFTYYN